MTWFDADFGSDYAGLRVGVTQLGADGLPVVPRDTVSVIALGNGAYGANLTIANGVVTVRWDTGQQPPIYAQESVLAAPAPVVVPTVGEIAAEVWAEAPAVTTPPTADEVATAVWNKTLP